MFNAKHYIPILKWKRGEQRALNDLEVKTKKDITPLIELVMPKVSSIYKDREKKIKKTAEEMTTEMVDILKEKRIKEIPNEILSSWGKDSIFVDVSLLHDGPSTPQLKVDCLNEILSLGAGLGLQLIPTVYLNEKEAVKNAVSIASQKYNSGLCLRVAPSDLINLETLNGKVETFLLTYHLEEKDIDLLIDTQSVREKGGKYASAFKISQEITNLKKWRNFIFSSGSFPENLNDCKFGEPKLLPRFDWINWFTSIQQKNITRVPTYSDYTIRNPIYSETTQFYSATTSLKYSLDSEWIIFKGKVREFKYYLASASLLAGHADHYYGEDHCAGDKFISEKALHFPKYMKNPLLKGTGGSEDWIYVAINHHLVLVTDQISSLF